METKKKMISGRINEPEAQAFSKIIRGYRGITVEKFVNFSVEQLLSGNIYISGTQFKIKNDY